MVFAIITMLLFNTDKIQSGSWYQKLTNSFAKIKQRSTNLPNVNTKCCAFEPIFFAASS